jgi:RimJ/RimL family protein N-acetyltransferase
VIPGPLQSKLQLAFDAAVAELSARAAASHCAERVTERSVVGAAGTSLPQNLSVVEAGNSGPYQLVRLRRATLDDVRLLELWSSSPHYMGEFNDFGLSPPPKVYESIEKNGLVGEHGGTLMVEQLPDSEPIGTVSWRLVRYNPNLEYFAWNIGVSLIPEARGRGFGTQAQRILADHLLATTSVNRIEAATDIENLAEQRSLEKAGFIRDGVLRGAQYRAGAWHDLAIYSVVRG